jgi:hypothetical protein
MESSEFVRLSARMPARPWRLVARVALAVATVVAVPTATLGAPGPLGGATRAADPAGTLVAALDRARAAHGREPLYPRADYAERARAAVSSVAEGANVPVQVDGAALVSAVVPGHDTGAVEHAMAGVVARLDRVLASELYTDAGVAVAKVATSRGDRSVAVAVVGWPRPALAAETGCSVAGYCWGNRGVNRHLPWTRNRIEVRLSTVNLPAGAAAVVRAGIVRLNQVPGFGADVVLAGMTPHTAPAGDHRFVVAFGSQASCGAGILACARPFVYGDGQVHAGAITLVRTRWDPRQAELWTGTVAHELGHLLGLTHYDARRADGYQLIKPARPDQRGALRRRGGAAGARAAGDARHVDAARQQRRHPRRPGHRGRARVVGRAGRDPERGRGVLHRWAVDRRRARRGRLRQPGARARAVVAGVGRAGAAVVPVGRDEQGRRPGVRAAGRAHGPLTQSSS